MKDYKVENPQFTDTLQITETTDTSHADNINRAPKQAFENTLYLEKSKVAVDGGDVSDTVIKTEGDAGEEDYPVPEAGDTSKTFLGKTKKFISNFKDWMTGVCMLGAIVNNCVTDNPNLPLSAAQGKALQDALTVLNNELKETSNNLSDKQDKVPQPLYLRDININDWNNVSAQGWYSGYNSQNAPTSGWVCAINIPYNGDKDYSCLIATNGMSLYTRCRDGSTKTWTAWREFATK